LAESANNIIFTTFCILIIFTVFITACITNNSVTNNTITTPEQTFHTGIAPASDITEPITNQVQVLHSVTTDAREGIQDQPLTGPISITINSASKQLGLGEWGNVYSEPMAGNVYLVLNITVKNNDAKEGFNFSSSSLVVRDLDRGNKNRAMYVRDSLRKYLENYIVLPVTMKQNDIVSGQVLFEMNDSMNYKVNLIDDNKNVITYQTINFDNLLTTENPVNITINSARKVPRFNTSYPFPGHIFLILNATIKNYGVRPGFVFEFTSVNVEDLRNGIKPEHSLNGGVNLMKNLENPLVPGTNIKQNESVTGQIIFGIADSTEYRMNLIDGNKTIIASRDINVE
jgi:hypothetical protein